MDRFQAILNPVVGEDLSYIREKLGLRENQKAEILREATSIAAWAIRQVTEGNAGASLTEHALLGRLAAAQVSLESVKLSPREFEKLAQVLDRSFEPTPAMRGVLEELARADHSAPKVKWPAED